MRRMGIGLQLYTVRDETSKDFAGTLRKVAEVGYEGVEFAGYGGMQAEELKALLDELNLKAVGSHVSLDQLRHHLQEEIDFNLTIGNTNLICPYVPEELRGEMWREHFQLLKESGEKLKEHGITLAYHNHDFEFTEKLDGQYVFDALFAAAPNIDVELDACWVHAAGIDPAEYIDKYADRLKLLHLKDMRRDSDGVKTVILGEGEVDLDRVVSASANAKVEWLIVEQDECQIPSLESIERSMEWLKKNVLSKFE